MRARMEVKRERVVSASLTGWCYNNVITHTITAWSRQTSNTVILQLSGKCILL
jgi:hypothetical protein